ncbi:MAG TPA: 5-oxoprolinase subunit PxpA [Gammaproteobacteria bacterium]|nr:5-oxoprolinase subunit PxpA [Gammaproteobacteria bacterium]
MPDAGIIDLNADLGEGCGDDSAMLRIVSSANIACGAHAGDEISMRDTVQAAVLHGVTIGAHVSYPDREHFGRHDMDMPAAQLGREITRQIQALGSVAHECGTRVRYVKAHGALYNRMADDANLARVVIAAIGQCDTSMMLLTLPGSVAMQCAVEMGLRAVAEAFVDRAYTESGRLLPRNQAGAVLTDPETVAQRAVQMAVAGRVAGDTGKELVISARSLCVHGDTPGAVALAGAVRTALQNAGLRIAAFA